MAALTIRAVKLAVVGGAAIPVIGLTGRLSAASSDGHNESPQVRACDIPLYNVSKKHMIYTQGPNRDNEEKNEVQRQITNARIAATDLYQAIMSGYDSVKSKVNTGIDHSKATLNYVQTNDGELPRIGFISVATMGGVVLGFRGGIVRKMLYATIAGLSSASLCYPRYSVEFAEALKDDARSLWIDYIGWPLADNSDGKTPRPKVNKPTKPRASITGDHGQSKAEDKDLYSTRS